MSMYAGNACGGREESLVIGHWSLVEDKAIKDQ